jgi:hypothetical protein
MVNDPSFEAIKKFESRWGSTKRQSVSTEDRLDRIKALHAQWGNLTLAQFSASGDTEISVLVRSATAGTLELHPEFSTTETGKLDGMAIADGPGVQESRPLSAADRAAVIDAAAKVLRDSYVYPKVGESMAADIQAKLKSGAYDAVEDERSLATRLTSDCRDISHDRHLAVRLAAKEGASPGPEHGPPPALMQAENYAFKKVEILPGNIGYLRFDGFIPTDEAKQTAAAAMAFLAHCDSLIFDLRQNGGGSPEMIQFLSSYLFDEPTHLNDMVDREGNITEEFWTLKDVPGARFPRTLPVFVLTSSRTFSGAEEFTYNLKNLKRATIVGETTGGGAHPVRAERISDRFLVMVPYMRAQNPITRTNWEGTGVEPDIKVPASEALDKAQALAKEAPAAHPR